MKKSVLFMTAALAFGVAGAQAPVTTTAVQAPALTDVPAGHWAKDAVERLVSEGIILGYPDGTYRGTQTLTRYEAAMIINRLLDRMGSGDVVIGDIDDATMVALRNAINELSAQGADFEVRLADLEANAVSQADFARLEGRVDALATTGTDNTDVAGQLATINDLATLLNQDVLELQDRVIAVDGELATFDDRLGLVENQVVENTQVLAGHELRVSDLENGRVKLTLGLGGDYGHLELIKGNENFDVDRLTNKTFAEKVFSGNDGKVDKTDTDNYENGFKPGITLGLSATNIDAGNNIFVEKAGVELGAQLAYLEKAKELESTDKGTDAAVVTLQGADITGRIGDDARFRAVAKVGTVPMRPDVVHGVGKLADVHEYNKYLLPNGGNNGVVAGVALTDVPLKPTLYLGGGYGTKDTLKGPWFAVRTEAKLGDKGTIGVSLVQDNAVNGYNGHTAFGVDASYTQVKLGTNEGESDDAVLYGVKGTYVASLPDVINAADKARAAGIDADFNKLWESRDQAAVVKAEANLFNVGFDADFRAVSPGFKDGKAGLDIKKKTPEFTDEVGYGASLSTKVGQAEIGAFGDTYTDYNDKDWSNRRTGLGAHAGANLSSFRAVAFGGYATAEGAGRTGSGLVTTNDNVIRYDDNKVKSVKREDIFKPAKTIDLYRYTSSVGALVTHDGSQINPLIPNLDLALEGNYFYNSGDTYLAAVAAYNAKINNITVTPFLGYSRYDQKENNRINAKNSAADNSQLTYGVDLKTQPFNVAFKPDLKISAAKTDYTAGTLTGTSNGNEIGAKVQVGLNEFLSPATKLNLGYAYQRANNLTTSDAYPADFSLGGKVALPKTDGVGKYNQTQGVFAQLSWNDALSFNYGLFYHDKFTSDGNKLNDTNVAQGFKVSYKTKF